MLRTARSLFALGLTAALFTLPAAAASPTPAKPAAREAPAAAREKIAYDDLPKYLGERIVVHTTYQTTRTGKLTRTSKSELTLGIDTPEGATEFTIPRATVAEIVLVPPSAGN